MPTMPSPDAPPNQTQNASHPALPYGIIILAEQLTAKLEQERRLEEYKSVLKKVPISKNDPLERAKKLVIMAGIQALGKDETSDEMRDFDASKGLLNDSCKKILLHKGDSVEAHRTSTALTADDFDAYTKETLESFYIDVNYGLEELQKIRSKSMEPVSKGALHAFDPSLDPAIPEGTLHMHSTSPAIDAPKPGRGAA